MYKLELKDVIGDFIDAAFDYSTDEERIKDFLQGMIAAIPIVISELEWNHVDDGSAYVGKDRDYSAGNPISMPCPESTMIKSIEYWPKAKELFVEFRKTGKVYSYQDVPAALFNEFMGADSKGKYFNQFIKTKYQYADVTIIGREEN